MSTICVSERSPKYALSAAFRMKRPPGYGGQWEGYGEMGYKTAPERRGGDRSVGEGRPGGRPHITTRRSLRAEHSEEHVDAVIEHGRRKARRRDPERHARPFHIDAVARNLVKIISTDAGRGHARTPEVLSPRRSSAPRYRSLTLRRPRYRVGSASRTAARGDRDRTQGHKRSGRV